ncbi:hypothetical protein CY34DRAFT_18648 [Suillus luteus UH-Slu-Lm8-n1]|uniref:Uncharacterized protein n=1 Tax=Suillus luteus UH-Slu-Lm8-n1 TaxID=930992 RepID=A0A0D0A498_9AGAM|nr:hypothetical protein CY34DRAFT_18648 [Suillus luteus UH-Slu-Lm8-n1]
MPRSEAMIVKWPEATKTVLASLSAEEKEEANVLADKWNNEAAPPEVQGNLAKIKGADMIEHFATEMFKQAGMRVFVMSAWRDSRGKLMLGAHDHNDQCGAAKSFMKTRNWEEIFMPEWRQYAGEQFDVQDDDIPQVVTSKKRVPRKLLELEEDNDGLPMLPETKGGCFIHNIHRYEHFTGMCIGTEKVKAAVPWGDLIKNQSDFFDGTYWLADIQVVEPSKMDKAGATALLDFWYDRQQKKLRPIFCFKAWKDTDGEMEPPAKAYQKLIRRKTAHHAPKSAKASKQAPKHVEDTEESLDDREEYQSDDGEGVISDHHREPSAKSDQKVICRSSHRNTKAHAALTE